MTMMTTAPLTTAIVVAIAIPVHAKTQVHRADMGADYVGIGADRAEQTQGEDSGDQQFHWVAPG
jgi:hypothetical protein